MVWPTIMWRGKRRTDRCQSEPYTLPAFCQSFFVLYKTPLSALYINRLSIKRVAILVLNAGGCPQANRDQDCYQLKWAVLLSHPSTISPKEMHLQPHLDHLHNTFFFSKADPASIFTEPCPFCPAVRVKRRQASSGIIARSTEPRWTNQQP